MAASVLLLTGSTGFIGQRLLPGLARHWRVIAASRNSAGRDAVALDLADPGAIARAFDSVGPAAIVHAGGIADPDACEREPELAQRVNVEAVTVLAGLCAKTNARLVHFSTDYVFDGAKSWYREDDAAQPLSVYGRGKLESEAAVLSLCPGSVVLRVSNCYGRPLGGRTCFVDHWQTSLAAGRTVPGFTDQWRSSTAGDQLPDVVRQLLARPELRGIFHWGGADRTTRYEAALTYCRVMGYDERLVHPARAADRHFPAARPRDTSLDSSRLASALGVAPVGLLEGFKALNTARA
jgi:dTDP-4-dehydrorhamnose reductase